MFTLSNLQELYQLIDSGKLATSQGMKVIRKFPNLDLEFEKYKRELEKTPFIPRVKINVKQIFEKSMFMGPGNLEYVTRWNIDKADFLIKRMNNTLFPLEFLKKSIETNQVNLSAYKGRGAINYNNPIYVIMYAANLEGVIIDGNHRVAKALSDGVEAIPAYLFFNGEEMDLLADPHSVLMYKLHYNVGKILAYMIGKIDYIKYTKSFDLESLFDI